MFISRFVSILVACVYLLIAFFGGENAEGFKGVLGVSLILGLSCIWFGEELGGAVGYIGHARITNTTPASVVRFVGWLLLLFLPVLGYILHKYAM